ncbi:16S rRNA (adenine(1518)-N(6)/adenine(1519)-N(6))-dimethyltransferase RsmA [Mahella australiensis]|uniref:Ribosomal RNA small subunit methyltransferase A n=1 Tax=Mahella australiensis (strain DSM 15567 / CIP 107919 / 50-1 BON) TaxID=697281 RepID=F4A1R7_MAHA5|nr:16S rRNA (adenine(1518)-N(6)/adenine(1519)-N(6))-dimethyltransferase RsmA [Mahella australiensis]AEE97117.1 dimethyladenosine transferase [Mahella australiensis 50-1 BON]
MDKTKDLSSKSAVQRLIDRYNFKPNKAMGQNFLINKEALNAIVNGADISAEDEVLEIGPGLGTLTLKLSERAAHVTAVEVDKRIIPLLKQTLQDVGNVSIIEGDFLNPMVAEEIKECLAGKSAIVVANLPYYITTPVLMDIIENYIMIKRAVLMMQKEVAYRVVAQPGSRLSGSVKDYGVLSISVQYYMDPQILLEVPRSDFLPSPDVDSAVVRLDRRDKPAVDVQDERMFFSLVKAAFGQRRKTLFNALAGGLGYPLGKDGLKRVLERAHIDGNRRAETLSLQEFADIANELFYTINS